MDINVEQLKSGNEKVFEAIVKSYWPRLLRFAQIYIIDVEVAKEVVQDTFLILWNQRSTLEDNTCLITYLMVVSRNKCLNYLKSLHLEQVEINSLNELSIYQRSNQHVLEDEALELLLAKELNRAIEVSLEKLPPRTREIFRKSRIEGLKNKEIAELENISVKAVEFHINKALNQLRSDLSKDYYITLLIFIIYFMKGR